MHTSIPKTNISSKGKLQTKYHVTWKVFPSAKREPTYKFIVNNTTGNFHICTVHLSMLKFLLPTDAQENCFKKEY